MGSSQTIMGPISCDISSGLVDLILSPEGSISFFHRLVPICKCPIPRAELVEELVSYCHGFGLTNQTISVLLDKGFISSALLALLPAEGVREKFPDLPGRQLDLLRFCIATID